MRRSRRSTPSRSRIVVVGPNERFLSGVSYYTAQLVRALSTHGPGADVISLRQLCPAAIYPGRSRIGTMPASSLDYGDGRVLAAVDWHWLRGLIPAVYALMRRPPRAVILQYWTGTALHTFLLLAIVARMRRIPVIVEYHETIETSEARRFGVPTYVRSLMALLARCTSGIVAHTTQGLRDVHATFPSTQRLPSAVITIASTNTFAVPEPRALDAATPLRLLHFGVLRSYKGLGDLAAAATQLVSDGYPFELVVAGELWDEAADDVAALERVGSNVRLELGYHTEAHLSELLTACDVVVLPYHRSVASGPLHNAMASGRAVVCSRIDTLVEASAEYSGATYATPGDPVDLARAIRASRDLAGVPHADPHSWAHNSGAFLALLERVERRT